MSCSNIGTRRSGSFAVAASRAVTPSRSPRAPAVRCRSAQIRGQLLQIVGGIAGKSSGQAQRQSSDG